MLYIVATPIGNLEDITLRALRILREVDLIACEDTRHTGLLLSKLNIKNSLISLHEYSDSNRIDEILRLLQEGKDIALCSDAGTPLISDPGCELLRRCTLHGITVCPIPGPSALTAALCLCPFGKSHTFLGFLPKSGKERTQALEFILESTLPVVIFESPKRISKTLNDLALNANPHRQAMVCRELTKLHEEFLQDSLPNLAHFYENNIPKGEIVLIVDGKISEESSDEEIISILLELQKMGVTNKEAAQMAASQVNASKNRIKKLLISLK